MVGIYTRPQIEAVVRPADVIAAMERGFVAYSRGEAVIPPVGHIDFEDPPGDCHIKYGYLRGGETFTVKIATGFWKNPKRGLPSSNGMILVFSSQTGEPLAILQDEGFLTDVRTAAAGAVAAKCLQRSIRCIGIVGAGIQAHLQLQYLKTITDCRNAIVWARSQERAGGFRVEGFALRVATSVSALLRECNLVVTTTPAREPLIAAEDVMPGTHITAVGADGGGKQEIDPALFARAKICAVDSRSQCSQYGDSSFALARRLIRTDDLVEVGEVIQNPEKYQRAEGDITIADLTGVAVQDIAIAELALDRLRDIPTSVPDRRGGL